MRTVREDDITPQERECSCSEGRLLHLHLRRSPEVGLYKILKGQQERLEGALQELEMLGLQKKPLMPEERSLDIHR
jgi:hypothetical protein